MQPNPPSRYDDAPTVPSYLAASPNVPPPPPQQYPLRRPRRAWHLWLLGCSVLLGSLVLSTLCGGFVVVSAILNEFGEQVVGKLEAALPKQEQAFQTARILDRYGNELYQLIGEGRRTKVRLSEISPHLIKATIAVEDASFYENIGIDVSAIVRAGLGYFSGADSGGGSTITQQLVRNIAFDYQYRTERSARRKLEEIAMAVALTQRKSKDEILEMYLNTIYYGNVAYGIEAAAQTYFGKRAAELNLAEAALLAGLPQAPAALNPFDSRTLDAVLARRRVVLDLMVKNGAITRAEADAAAAQPLIFADPNIRLSAPHFTLYAEQEVRSLLPALNLPDTYINFGGLTIYTTLDPRLQALAERAAATQIAQIKAAHNANNAAVVVLKPATGEILAMVGSVDYYDDSIDGRVNVTIAPRQPGSAIKPLTYAAAMERGFSAGSVLWDVETHIGTPGSPLYSPVNYDRTFHGPVRVRDALASSYNIPAVLTLRQVGVEALLSFSARLGIRSLEPNPARYGLSLTLGGGEVTPLELARAYSVFANEGRLVPTTSILCITNSDNEIVYEYEGGCAGRPRAAMSERSILNAASGKAVLDPRIAFVISDILADNNARAAAMGARSPLRTDGIVSSVKTGTTNNFRDNWTVGYTKNVVVAVWVGNSDNTPMRSITGLTGAAPIWNQVITGIYADPAIREALKVRGALRDDTLTPPPGLAQERLCALNSVTDLATDCQRGRAEWKLDSPPLVPDGSGQLVPSNDVRFIPTPPPTNGPLIERVESGVVRAWAQPVDPNFAAGYVANVRSPRGDPMPPPRYCLVPQEVRAQLPTAQPLLFIDISPFEDEYIYASAYAYARGLAILPRLVCDQQLLAAAPAISGVTAVISTPRAGETVTGTVYVTGTAAWAPGQALYFKMELQGPQFPEWTTFSEVSYMPVINGLLGNFGAAGLIPGTYQLRIVIVGMDANYLHISPPTPVIVTGW
ncbi:MAG: transglycosylase domain-containing protein [Aggregatilineales bacterium]